MIFVLGGGFGLYGHVAALADAGYAVAAPVRYRERALARPELAMLVDRVEWVDDEVGAIANAALTCLANRPADNCAMAERLVRDGTGGTLVLEKPIAPTWQQADTLERTMLAAGRRWRTPYLFLHCDWFALLADAVAQGRHLAVRWDHRQSPTVRGWKTAAAEGGGAVSFYFIHWLAVLEAVLPGSAARYFRERADGAECVGFVADNGAARFDVTFVLGDAAGFEIAVDGQPVHAALTPFGAGPGVGRPDPRIPVLQRFYRAVLNEEDVGCGTKFQLAVTARWRAFDAV